MLNNSGSEWNKWDFHVHTPYSILNNNYGFDPYTDADNDKKFDEFVQKLFLKAIENNIHAIGITDYFAIDGYKRIKECYLECPEKMKILFPDEEIRKQIKEIYVFPNIEMRLNTFVGKKANPVNYHIIFSDTISTQIIEENFLHRLTFQQDAGDNKPLTKFNIEEESYLRLAAKLYDTIKQLYLEWKSLENERLWTNLTIRIENVKFSVEYNYEPIISNERENQKRRIIWTYENLGFPIESFNREEKAMIQEYLEERRVTPKDTKVYTEGIYQNEKYTHNVISYGYENFEKEEISSLGEKRKQELEKELEEMEETEKKPHKRNQILN